MHSGALSSVGSFYFAPPSSPHTSCRAPSALYESLRNRSKRKWWVRVSVNSFTDSSLLALRSYQQRRDYLYKYIKVMAVFAPWGEEKQQPWFLVSLWLPLYFPRSGWALNEQITQWLTVARPHSQTITLLLQEFCVRISTHSSSLSNTNDSKICSTLFQRLGSTRFSRKIWIPLRLQNAKHILLGLRSHNPCVGA